MPLFRKNPPPAEAPDAVEAARLAVAAAAEALALAHVEVEAAGADVEAAKDFSRFPGDDTAAALAQLTAQRGAAKRAAAAAGALARSETAKTEAETTHAEAVHAERVRAAEQFNWGCEWAGRALLAGVAATPEGRPVQGLAAAVALAKQAVADREDLRDELADAGITPPPAPRLAIAAALSGLLSPETGLLGVYITAANVVRWEAELPRREKEIADNAAAHEADRRAHERRMALAGHLGEEARAAANAEVKAEMAAWYGRSSGTGFIAVAPAELSALQRVVDMNAQHEEG